ncbi:MAG: SDR family oxidoreductase [Pseudomonadota bacterium]
MSSHFGIPGKTALITAAAKGIGAETARVLAELGVRVAVNFRSESVSATALIESIRASGGEAFAVKGDASNSCEVEDIVDRAEQEFGAPVDIAVANLGPFQIGKLEELSASQFDDLIRSNLNATFYLAKAVLPQMKRRKQGVIIPVGLSPTSNQISAAPHIAGYACAKAALTSLTRSMASEFAPFGIRVAMVAPGLIEHSNIDPQQASWMAQRVPSGRLGTGREVANVIAFLASNLASYCSGGVFNVNGGWDWSVDRSTSYDSAHLMEHLGDASHG